jgi:osmotically-inducible protein OsmY
VTPAPRHHRAGAIGAVESPEFGLGLENRMKIAVWNVVPVLTLLALVPGIASGALPASQSAVEKTKDGAEKTKDAVVKAAKLVGDKTEDGLSKTGEVMTDGWITTRINQRFVGEPLLKDSKIDVDTSKHVVTLKGTVTGWAGRARAATVARRTEGVHRVVNQLTVGPKQTD